MTDSSSDQGSEARALTTHKTYCRVCQAQCAMEIDVDDEGRPVAVRGDRSDPVYKGYTCIKGRQLLHQYDNPGRIKKPLKKMPDGSFEEISLEQAYSEIAAIVKRNLDEHGGRSIASYVGTFGHMSQPAGAFAMGFHQGIDSPSYFTTATIDQIDKFLAAARFGIWAGGVRSFEESDAVMLLGINPPIAHSGSVPGGIPCANPAGKLNDFVKRGGTVICVDPRVSEVARKATYHLQIRPGEDPTLLAGMVRLVLEEGLEDREFVDRYLSNLEELKAALDDFTPDYVARRTGIDEDLFKEATRAFAAAKVGNATTGTGPDFSPNGMLSEHLALVLNAILGRYAREGDKAAYLKMLFPEAPRKAQVTPPNPAHGVGARSRVRGLGQLMTEMPSTTIPDEILEPGEGQIRVLFNVGGNPLAALPDQFKCKRALETLDLLVSVDIRMAETCRLSDYVLPAKMSLEREDVTMAGDFLSFYPEPYAHYTKAVCAPNGDPIDAWQFYFELARRLGTKISIFDTEIPLDKPLSTFEAIQAAYPHSRASIPELREHDGGKRYYEVNDVVAPADPDADARFDATPEGVLDEIRAVREMPLDATGRPEAESGFSHRLISRRLKNVHNSNGRDNALIRKRGTTNHAYINEQELTALGIDSGDLITISGRYGEIVAVAEATSELQPGVISMAHCWGNWSGEEKDVREDGASTSRLVATDQEFEPITGKGRMSSIPVNITPCR